MSQSAMKQRLRTQATNAIAPSLQASVFGEWIEDRPLRTQTSSRPQIRLLQGPIEIDYDPDDSPSGELVSCSEPPEVL